MVALTAWLAGQARRLRTEDGAIGWLILGVVIGAILIIVLVVQLIIPGNGE